MVECYLLGDAIFAILVSSAFGRMGAQKDSSSLPRRILNYWASKWNCSTISGWCFKNGMIPDSFYFFVQAVSSFQGFFMCTRSTIDFLRTSDAVCQRSRNLRHGGIGGIDHVLPGSHFFNSWWREWIWVKAWWSKGVRVLGKPERFESFWEAKHPTSAGAPFSTLDPGPFVQKAWNVRNTCREHRARCHFRHDGWSRNIRKLRHGSEVIKKCCQPGEAKKAWMGYGWHCCSYIRSG